MLNNPGTSTLPPRQLPESNCIVDGAGCHGGSAATPAEEAETLNPGSQTARSFDDSRDVVGDYSLLRAALAGPRGHRLFSFGRKRAVSATFTGFRVRVTTDAIQAPNSDTKEFQLHKEQAESSEAERTGQAPKTKLSTNRIIQLRKRMQQSVNEGDGVKRPSHNNIMHFGKRMMEEDVADAFQDMYATVDGAVSKKVAIRILNFGKRGLEYCFSNGPEGEPVFELVPPEKCASNRILHFGNRAIGSSMEAVTEDEMEMETRGPSGDRIMHFSKSGSDVHSGITVCHIEEASKAIANRATAARRKYDGKTHEIHSVDGAGRQLQKHLQKWKNHNRIPYFSKMESKQLQTRYYHAKGLGNRLMHICKRVGYNFLSGNVGPSSAVKVKLLQHSILHFGKRKEDLVSLMGGDKHNRIMHFRKHVGSRQDVIKGYVPMYKRVGNGTLYLGKRLEGSDVAASSSSWACSTDATPSSPTEVSKGARRILHFGKSQGDVAYQDKGSEAYPFLVGGDADDSGTFKVAGLGQPKMLSMSRKKRSTSHVRNDLGVFDPVHLSHEHVAAQMVVNVFLRMFGIACRSYRSSRSLESKKCGATKELYYQTMNEHIHPV